MTGGGGHHYYLRKPADLATVAHVAAYPGIDFKTVGGQVVAPGAVHPETGRRYESEFWLLGPDETPDAPQALLDLLRVRRLERPEGAGHDRWGELTPEALAANLEKLDPDDFAEELRWRELMMACHHATAGEGRQEFIEWSTGGVGYEDHGEVIGKRWDSLHATASRGGRAITVAHLFGLVTEAGETPLDRCEAEDDFEVVEQDEAGLPSLRRMKNGKPDTSFHNCLKLVRHINPQLGLKFNEFDRAAYLTADELPWSVDVGRRVNDDVLRLIRWYLVEGTEASWGKDDVLEAVLTVVREHHFHPVRDYLDGLKWDGVPRIDGLFTRYAGAKDTPYVRAIGAKALIAAVRRVRQPGCKFDNVVVLESAEQGRGKSTFIKLLAPNEDWFAEPATLSNVESKDAPLALEGKWIIEMGEMSALSKSAVESMKAFVSCAVDRIRRPYGRLVEDLPRQCIFMGTTNRDDYLKDPTGNRRFWPVTVGTDGLLDLEALVADRDQLWAEAAVREVQGESLFLPQELWAEAAAEQSDRVTEDPWADVLRDFLDGIGPDGRLGPTGPIDRAHSSALLSDALGIRASEQTPADSQRLKLVMTRTLGWVHKKNLRAGPEGKQGRGYERPSARSRDSEEGKE
ncbi:MAG: VapE domain-containing protein [Trueperaceae bacterium]